MRCFFLLVYYLSSSTCTELLSRHRRSWIMDSFTIEEGHPGPFPYVLGKVDINRDYRPYFDLIGEGVDKEPKGVLSIHKETGTISVHRAVDYEQHQTLKLKFEARKSDSSIDTKLGVEISILDINDNPPLFLRDLYEISIDEGDTQGSRLQTVVAHDKDQPRTPNSTFHYEIKSVSPNPPDTEFFIDKSGTISFKGCLDHEVAETFKVLVEAKDHGEKVSLSSSTTVVMHVRDGNNHLPTISGQTGSGKVKEDEVGASPLRLLVTDKDSPNSPAWRARYTIQGDEGEHFKIETDPDTNDGVLTVVKPLNFEEGSQRELSISVENELPYFSCKVKEKTSSGLWKVDTIKGDDPAAGQSHSVKVTIEVEDVNDPPMFSVTVKEAVVEENVPVGTWVERVTAVDPDSSHSRDFLYKVGNDPAGWVTLDPHTGDITTVKMPDRESPYVVDGIYTIILHAVDDGNPPMTGTATVNIHVNDENDNVPKLMVDTVDMCVSDEPTTTNITAFDLDENPFGGPFTFELLGDVTGKWKLSPSYGYTAGLVKDPGVYAGPYTIDLKISDMQGEFAIYNLRVTVCDCSVTANCRSRRVTATTVGFDAIGIMVASLFLLLLLLLMVFFVSCKKEFISLQSSDWFGEPGTDCKAVSKDKKHQDPSNWQSQHDGMQHTQFSSEMRVHGKDRNNRFSQQDMENNSIYGHVQDYRREDISYLFNDNLNQIIWNSLVANGHHHTRQVEDMTAMNSHYKRNSSFSHAILLPQLDRQLHFAQKREEDLLDDQFHLYADEGDSHDFSELENISIPDEDSYQEGMRLGPLV